MLSEEQALQCEARNPTSCACRQLLTECLFGPDSRGNLVRTQVTWAEANSCDRADCTCEWHGKEEYLRISQEREESAHDRVSKAREREKLEEKAYLASKGELEDFIDDEDENNESVDDNDDQDQGNAVITDNNDTV